MWKNGHEIMFTIKEAESKIVYEMKPQVYKRIHLLSRREGQGDEQCGLQNQAAQAGLIL